MVSESSSLPVVGHFTPNALNNEYKLGTYDDDTNVLE